MASVGRELETALPYPLDRRHTMSELDARYARGQDTGVCLVAARSPAQGPRPAPGSRAPCRRTDVLRTVLVVGRLLGSLPGLRLTGNEALTPQKILCVVHA